MKKCCARIIIFSLFSVVSVSVLTACSKGDETAKQKPDNPPIPVTITVVLQKNIPLTIQAIGNAESCQTVAIKGQVDGEIITTHIVDGQEVQKNDPLFDLDDRRFRQRLVQLKANLEKDLAALELARSKEHRQRRLNKENIASEENLSIQIANRKVAQATVDADKGAIAEGELQLAFTHIQSPISGVAGRILIHTGNLVKANDTNPLVIINQVDPMCIIFTIAEHFLDGIREKHAKGPLTLQVTPNRDPRDPIPATLLSIDNTIDRQTASIRIKAQADNPQRRLWPGMFVTLTLKLADRPDALMIPTQAIQTGPKGTFVYVVKADKTVELRSITLAQEGKDDAVVLTGVTAGEIVVTVGQWRLKPGAPVEIIQPKNSEKTTDKKKQGEKL